MTDDEPIDTSLVGETVVGLMESLNEGANVGDEREPWPTGSRVTDVLVVVCVDDGESATYRVKSSTDVFHEKVGMLHAALDVLDD